VILEPSSFFDFEKLKKGDCWALGCILYELVTGNKYQTPDEAYESTDWELHLNNKINDIDREGWELDDIRAVEQSLRGLLNPNARKRNMDSMNDFINHHS